MGTILKYIFYIVLILVVYLIAKGIYDGKITESTTVKEVGTDISSGTQQLVDESRQAIDKHTKDMKAKNDSAAKTEDKAE